MAVKRSKKRSKRAAPRGYRPAMPAEGATAIDALGWGEKLGSVFGALRRKGAAKRSATKTTGAKAKTARARKKLQAGRARRA